MLKFWKFDRDGEKKVITVKRKLFYFDTLQTVKVVLSEQLKVHYSEIALFNQSRIIGFPIIKTDSLKDGESVHYTSTDSTLFSEKNTIQNINSSDVLIFESTTPLYFLLKETVYPKDVNIEVATITNSYTKKFVKAKSKKASVFWPTYEPGSMYNSFVLPPQYSKYVNF